MIEVIEFQKHIDIVWDKFVTIGSKCDFLLKSSSSSILVFHIHCLLLHIFICTVRSFQCLNLRNGWDEICMFRCDLLTNWLFSLSSYLFPTLINKIFVDKQPAMPFRFPKCGPCCIWCKCACRVTLTTLYKKVRMSSGSSRSTFNHIHT